MRFHVSWTLAKKFTLLGVLGGLLFLLPFGIYLQRESSALARARQEQDAVAPALALLHVVQLTQQHRGLFSAGLEAERAAKQAQADAAYGHFGSAIVPRLPAGPAVQGWASIASEWQDLARDAAQGKLQKDESFARHTRLIERAMDLGQQLSEQASLAYDADPATHHLVQATLVELPRLAETLGQIRARGAGALAAGKLETQRRGELAGLGQSADLLRRQAGASLAKAGRANPALEALATATARPALTLCNTALALLEEQILLPDTLSLAPAAWFAAMTRTIDADFALQDAAGESLRSLLEQRIGGARRTLLLVGLGLLAGALAVALGGVLVMRSSARPIRATVELARRVAEGDLTMQLEAQGTDELARMQQALSAMVLQLRQLLANVATGARVVAEASAQIAQGNADLSERSEEQASNLEETASSMEELTSTCAANADNAREVSRFAQEASAVAARGGSVVEEVVRTMGVIATASGRIQEIVTLIDGIAFQTNILALNAAVEAARAGEHGRGFAVVASEVRALAQRTASAAHEVKTLITESAGQVDAGKRLVQEAGGTMREIVGSVARMKTLVADIAAASHEQASGLQQVSTALAQIDQTVQQNAALVEEAAAGTEAMKSEAQQLLEGVSRFRLEAARATDGQEDPRPAVTARPLRRPPAGHGRQRWIAA
jgi:methyl-accepting chemotaxis protein